MIGTTEIETEQVRKQGLVEQELSAWCGGHFFFGAKNQFSKQSLLFLF